MSVPSAIGTPRLVDVDGICTNEVDNVIEGTRASTGVSSPDVPNDDVRETGRDGTDGLDNVEEAKDEGEKRLVDDELARTSDMDVDVEGMWGDIRPDIAADEFGGFEGIIRERCKSVSFFTPFDDAAAMEERRSNECDGIVRDRVDCCCDRALGPGVGMVRGGAEVEVKD